LRVRIKRRKKIKYPKSFGLQQRIEAKLPNLNRVCILFALKRFL